MVLERIYKIRLISCLILTLFAMVILITYLVPKNTTFRLPLHEASQIGSTQSSSGLLTTEHTTDFSINTFMGIFSTASTTTSRRAQLVRTKATRDFPINKLSRKVSTSSKTIRRQAQLETTKATTDFPINMLLRKASTSSKTITWQAQLVTTKATTGFPRNKLVGKVSTISRTISRQSTAKFATTKASTDTPITLFVRMAGKLPEHRHRYFCDLFRTTVLYWPSSYGKTVIVLDDEENEDHEFGDKVISETKKYFPDRKLEVHYEALPRDKNTLDFQGSPKTPGYNRQLWSSFFIDLYSNDAVIAWVDTDAAFFTPVTKSSIFNGTKLRTLGSGCTFYRPWVNTWARTTELALGLPFVVDFMTYFPVYIYRDTFAHCREHILKRFNTRNFEEAFRKFYKGYISPVSIVMGYAWYFERDRYDWNFEICNDLSEYNKRFPKGHTIGPEHVETILSEPQTAFHGHPGKSIFTPKILASYCLSHKAAGNKLNICSRNSVSLRTNLAFFKHDLQGLESQGLDQKPCIGSNFNKCLQVLRRHYNQVGLEIKQGRKLQWRNIETAEMLAREFDIQCPPLK